MTKVIALALLLLMPTALAYEMNVSKTLNIVVVNNTPMVWLDGDSPKECDDSCTLKFEFDVANCPNAKIPEGTINQTAKLVLETKNLTIAVKSLVEALPKKIYPDNNEYLLTELRAHFASTQTAVANEVKNGYNLSNTLNNLTLELTKRQSEMDLCNLRVSTCSSDLEESNNTKTTFYYVSLAAAAFLLMLMLRYSGFRRVIGK